MVRRLLLLNGLAILFSIVHHSVHWVLTSMFWWADRYSPVAVPDYSQVGSVTYYLVRLIDQVAFVAVPAFLLVSGFFVASSTARTAAKPSWKVTLHRLPYLFIPYLIWSLFTLLIRSLEGNVYTLAQVVRTILLGTAQPPYYYVPLLMLLYILAPLFAWLAQDHWQTLLAITIFVQIPQFVARYAHVLGSDIPFGASVFALFRDWHLVEFAFWFALGIVIGFHLPQVKRFLSRHRRMILAGAIITFFAGLLEWEVIRRVSGTMWPPTTTMLGNKLYALFFLLAYLTFTDVRIPFAPQLSQIGRRSYGLYLLHVIVLEIAARSLYHLAPPLLALPLLLQLILVVAATAVPYLMMEFVNRLPIRRYYVYLFG